MFQGELVQNRPASRTADYDAWAPLCLHTPEGRRARAQRSTPGNLGTLRQHAVVERLSGRCRVVGEGALGNPRRSLRGNAQGAVPHRGRITSPPRRGRACLRQGHLVPPSRSWRACSCCSRPSSSVIVSGRLTVCRDGGGDVRRDPDDEPSLPIGRRRPPERRGTGRWPAGIEVCSARARPRGQQRGRAAGLRRRTGGCVLASPRRRGRRARVPPYR